MSALTPGWAFFEELDRFRRLQGLAMDAVGLGPRETPHEVVLDEPGVRLRRYGAEDGAAPPLLIVPAPIKRPYIWDMAPESSAVRRCVESGMRVHLAEWQPAGAEFGLAEYADRLLLDCLDAAGAGRAMLVAHSLGGLFAAIFAALHPERVRGLVLLAAPLAFGAGTGVLNGMIGGLQLDALPDSVPGSFLSAASLRASPQTFGSDRWIDFLQSVAAPAALSNHLRVERWTLDESPLPRRLVAELAELILKQDRFVKGVLEIGGRVAAPGAVAAPLLCVHDPRCRVVPPDSVLPFCAAAASRDKTLLEYHGDVGVSLQHVGMLVGREAHRLLWPQIVRWIRAHRV